MRDYNIFNNLKINGQENKDDLIKYAERAQQHFICIKLDHIELGLG